MNERVYFPEALYRRSFYRIDFPDDHKELNELHSRLELLFSEEHEKSIEHGESISGIKKKILKLDSRARKFLDFLDKTPPALHPRRELTEKSNTNCEVVDNLATFPDGKQVIKSDLPNGQGTKIEKENESLSELPYSMNGRLLSDFDQDECYDELIINSELANHILTGSMKFRPTNPNFTDREIVEDAIGNFVFETLTKTELREKYHSNSIGQPNPNWGAIARDYTRRNAAKLFGVKSTYYPQNYGNVVKFLPRLEENSYVGISESEVKNEAFAKASKSYYEVKASFCEKFSYMISAVISRMNFDSELENKRAGIKVFLVGFDHYVGDQHFGRREPGMKFEKFISGRELEFLQVELGSKDQEIADKMELNGLGPVSFESIDSTVEPSVSEDHPLRIDALLSLGLSFPNPKFRLTNQEYVALREFLHGAITSNETEIPNGDETEKQRLSGIKKLKHITKRYKDSFDAFGD